MPISLDIENFRGLRRATLIDDGVISYIIGPNEAGKSSLVGAIQYCLTGSAFGHKGRDNTKLITHGENTISVKLRLGTQQFQRTRTTGDAIKGIADSLAVPSEVLPLLFDAKLAGDGGSRAMKAFLDSSASVSFDAVKHFEGDTTVLPCITYGRQAGKTTTKQLIAFFEDRRAQQKEPPKPVLPLVPRPGEDTITTAQKAQDQAVKIQEEVQDTLEFYESSLASFEAIETYRAALENYKTKAAETQVKDVLGSRRNILKKVTGVSVGVLDNIHAVLVSAELMAEDDACRLFDPPRESTMACIATAKAILANHPVPPEKVTEPPLDPKHKDILRKLIDNGVFTSAKLPGIIATQIELVADARTKLTEARSNVSKAREAFHTLLQQKGAWAAYDTAVPAYDIALQKSKDEWNRWDNAITKVREAEAAYINASGAAFSETVSEFGELLLNGRKVKIIRGDSNTDDCIMLGDDPIEECSESTRWRIEIAIMAAVAKTLQSPLLLIDGADILDIENRKAINSFLIKRVVKHFQHIIITATPRGELKAEEPANTPGLCKWTLEKGELRRLG